MEKKFVKFDELSDEDIDACFNGGKLVLEASETQSGCLVEKLEDGNTKITIKMTAEMLQKAKKRIDFLKTIAEVS